MFVFLVIGQKLHQVPFEKDNNENGHVLIFSNCPFDTPTKLTIVIWQLKNDHDQNMNSNCPLIVKDLGQHN